MSFSDTEVARVMDAVNRVYFATDQAVSRDPGNGLDAVRRNAPRVSRRGDFDVITPPISLSTGLSRPTVIPFEARVAAPDVSVVSTEGVVNFAQDDTASDGRTWRYSAALEGQQGHYEVRRTARNGDVYVFRTHRPTVVTKAAEIVLGELSGKVDSWGRHFFAGD